MNKDKQRILSKIHKDENGCWLFTGAIHWRGYGAFWFKNKTISAHRASYELFKGPIEKNLLVCHHCDVQRCVNPDHLFLGTNQDNSDDMTVKKRNKRGVDQHYAKLSESDVIYVRGLFEKAMYRKKSIALIFKIDPSTVASIINRETWKHI